MTTLYIDRKNANLDHDAGALVVHTRDARNTIPLAPVERIVLYGGGLRLTTRLLAACWDRQIGVITITGRRQQASARFPGRPPGDAALKLAQYAAVQDDGWRARAARRLIVAKLRGQLRHLAMRRTTPRDSAALSNGVAQVAAQVRRLNQQTEPPTPESLVGIEGVAARGYFAALSAQAPDGWGFHGRSRRPPRDPVNAALSLGYTLLHGEAVRECQIAGFDHMIGFYHELDHGRESLACDVVEPLRPSIDGLVWRMFAERQLRPEHTHMDGEACLLGKTGRARFYDGYEAHAPTLRNQLKRVIRVVSEAMRTR